MSKFLMAFGVCLFDATAAILSVVHSSSVVLVLIASLVTSFATAMVSKTLISIFRPNYFWSDSEANQ